MEEPTQPLKCTVKDCEEERADQRATATNGHCKKHRAEAQRRYQKTVINSARSRAYRQGIEDFRKILVHEFEQQGSGAFAGVEIAVLIKRAPGPGPLADEAEESAADSKNGTGSHQGIPAEGVIS